MIAGELIVLRSAREGLMVGARPPPPNEPVPASLRADVERMIHDGTFSDAKSMAAYTLLLLHRQRSDA